MIFIYYSTGLVLSFGTAIFCFIQKTREQKAVLLSDVFTLLYIGLTSWLVLFGFLIRFIPEKVIFKIKK